MSMKRINETNKRRCPVCGGDVKGNSYGFWSCVNHCRGGAVEDDENTEDEIESEDLE